MKKLLITVPGMFLCVVTLIGCGSNESFEDKLKKLPNITSVKKIDNIDKGLEAFKEKYVVTFSQPIDWNNSALGTFNQKVYVYYTGLDNVTEYYINGYGLPNEEAATKASGNELSKKYNANMISIEYRFFDDSTPEGFSLGGTKFYNHLTSENACNDFHRIIDSFKTLLTGKTILSGGSKGGYTTETMAYYHPNDIDAYVSYVAPLCNGDNDERFLDAVYNTIGDEAYGKEKGKECRDIISKFLTDALDKKLRPTLTKLIVDETPEEGKTKIELSVDEIYETLLTNFPVSVWMYYQNFEGIDKVNKMPFGTQEEVDAKVKAMTNILGRGGLYIENESTPYYVQAYTEMGDYFINVDYLRRYSDDIKTPKGKKTVGKEICLTPAQREHFAYSPFMRDRLIDFYNTTTKDFVKISGLSDPWYFVSAPKTENKHVHAYYNTFGHMSTINTLDETQKNECWNVISNLLGK